ncbi:14-3-3 protein [Cryptosporidium canis]|uniref:14-3-3 protein n=1 Tax=Cryptosporidium canis TaxID=195482 RepID=A0ABQ8P5A5_9CRYT|nr:14-3-3 protein [Cryptosporidium canis]KAJ1606095.1 14-3-3 protein [Cryptosporidium canis]
MKLSDGAYKAKLADMVGSYNDVIKVLTASSDFRDNSLILLLAGSLRNRVTSIRGSLKSIKAQEEALRREEGLSGELAQVVEGIKQEFEESIMLESEDVIRIIDDNLLMYATEGTRAFCIKLKGDLMRYRAEILRDEERRQCIRQAVELYEDALERERSFLKSYPSDPLYLATVLNYAILKYDLLNNTEGAMKFVNRAIQAAENSRSGSEAFSENSEKLLKILKDNVAQWEQGSKGLLTSAFF